jgi:flagellar hook-length control protein FliK
VAPVAVLPEVTTQPVGQTPVATPEAPTQTAPVAQQAAPTQPKPVAQPVSAPAPAQPAAAGGATQQAAEQQQPQAPAQQQQPQAQAQEQQQAPQQAPPAAAPAAPVAPAAAPAAAARPAPPTPTATPIPLPRAAEAVEHVLHVIASRGGVTHARIALHPAELGSVDVHIRSTAEGLVARVVAHTAEAVQTLQNAANDLRQSLEDKGLNLMSLDIGQPGERDAGRAAGDAGGHSAVADELVAGDDEDTTTETLRLPSGVLVDVLA